MSSSPAPLPFDATQLVGLGRVTAIAPSPDGTWVAVAVSQLDRDRARYVGEIWRVSLAPDASAQPPVRLTRGRSHDHSPAFRRDGSLGFLSDRPVSDDRDGHNGDDKPRPQVWLLPAAGGEPRPLTEEPLGVRGFRFARDADVLVALVDMLPGVPFADQRARARERARHGPTSLRYTRMPVRHWDHWLPEAAPHLVAYDADGRDRRDLTPDADREHRECDWDLSADGGTVVVTSLRPGPERIDDQGLTVIDVATGAARNLGAEERVQLGTPRLSPDGRAVACVRHRRVPESHGPLTLHLYDIATGSSRQLAEGWDRWPTLAEWTPDGAALIATADDRGQTPVVRVDTVSGEVTTLTARATGGTHTDVRVVAGGALVVGLRSRLTHPPEPFSVALAPESAPRLLAHLSGFDPARGEAIARVESREVAADDGVAVQYFLLTPASDPSEASPAPAAGRPVQLWVHGGPRHAWADVWHWRWNGLVAVARGYAVALPNPRGSTGFGQAFIEGIWRNRWGEQCYRDVLAVADALAREPGCDGARMAALGASFGGYMVNWIGGNTDRFRCLVSHAGIYAFSSFHGVTDSPMWWSHELGGPPYEGTEHFDRYSPHRAVARWKTPTLVTHGEKDYRVPVSEALALFEALQHHGVPSELLVFPDENHWILRPRNTVAWYDAVLEFVGRYLGEPRG